MASLNSTSKPVSTDPSEFANANGADKRTTPVNTSPANTRHRGNPPSLKSATDKLGGGSDGIAAEKQAVGKQHGLGEARGKDSIPTFKL